MWVRIIKILLWLSPYILDVVNYLLKLFNTKTVMEEKIKLVSQIIDDELPFNEYAKKVKNPFLKPFIAGFELIDGKIIRSSLTELVNYVPEDKKWIVEKYFDAIIAKSWSVVIENTSQVVNVFIDIPGATEKEEHDAMAAVLLVVFKYFKSKAERMAA